MKKRFLLFSLFVFLFLGVSVNANTIEKISMDIYVDEKGDAHVTEVWNATLNSGTEGYKPYYNLGNAEITD